MKNIISRLYWLNKNIETMNELLKEVIKNQKELKEAYCEYDRKRYSVPPITLFNDKEEDFRCHHQIKELNDEIHKKVRYLQDYQNNLSVKLSSFVLTFPKIAKEMGYEVDGLPEMYAEMKKE